MLCVVVVVVVVEQQMMMSSSSHEEYRDGMDDGNDWQHTQKNAGV